MFRFSSAGGGRTGVVLYVFPFFPFLHCTILLSLFSLKNKVTFHFFFSIESISISGEKFKL